ncbi:MAG: hypothetical protein KKD98_03615, partial [Candidatus Thermoplasmatota archaeon]|nr:hypothetical protein [Candidatus Thermoplasmatota archaeon]
MIANTFSVCSYPTSANPVAHSGFENLSVPRSMELLNNQSDGFIRNSIISINGYKFDCLNGEPKIRDEIRVKNSKPGEIATFIIHIGVLITQIEIDTIRNMNITIIGSIPWNAYKVRMTPEQAQLTSNLSFVDWVGFFHPAYKISGDLDPEQTDVKIIMYGPEIPDAAIEQVRLKFH